MLILSVDEFIPPKYQDFVIKDGELIGNWEGLYTSFEDPWNQSRSDHTGDSCRQLAIIWCQKLRSLYGVNRTIELGCGFGFMTDSLRQLDFESVGVDISHSAILKAKSINPNSNFEVKNYNDFNFYNNFKPDIIIMAELTWYVLDSLESYLLELKNFAKSSSKPIFLIHLLATYKIGVQKYGSE
jgi:predicted TPR repeat methyltransferase